MYFSKEVVASRIKTARKDMGLTQVQLSKELGVSESAIKMYETAQRVPEEDTLKKMSELFNLGTYYLLGLTDSKMNWDKWDKDHLNEVKKLRQELGFLEYVASLNCDVSDILNKLELIYSNSEGELSPEAEQIIEDFTTCINGSIKSVYDDFLNEKGVYIMTRTDVNVIMNDSKNQIIDDFSSGTITVYATSEEQLEKAYQQLIRRGMIRE